MRKRNRRYNGRKFSESTGQKPEQSPYTIEGQIEGYGRFARGASRVRGWRRFVAHLVVWIFILSFAIGVIIGLINVAREMQ